MKQRFRLIGPGLFLVILVVLFGRATLSFAGTPGERTQGPPPSPVRVASVVEEMVSEQLSLVGSTEPKIRSIIAAEVKGLVTSLPVEEGDFVKKGAALVRLRSTDLNIRLRGAIAAKKEAEARFRFAETELARSEKLKNTNSIAAKRYDEVLYDFQALKEQVARCDTQIEELKEQIRKKTVTAPFSGFLARKHTEVGEWISEGGKVVTMVDPSLIRVLIDMPERYIRYIGEGDTVRVVIGASRREPFSGTISAILPEGNPDSRTFPVRIDIPNPDFTLKSGMEAIAAFNLGKKRKMILVPKDAIVTADGKRLVFVVNDGIVRQVNIKTTGAYGTRMAVRGSLKAGDSLVVRGNERLEPGQPVLVLPLPTPDS